MKTYSFNGIIWPIFMKTFCILHKTLKKKIKTNEKIKSKSWGDLHQSERWAHEIRLGLGSSFSNDVINEKAWRKDSSWIIAIKRVKIRRDDLSLNWNKILTRIDLFETRSTTRRHRYLHAFPWWSLNYEWWCGGIICSCFLYFK